MTPALLCLSSFHVKSIVQRAIQTKGSLFGTGGASKSQCGI